MRQQFFVKYVKTKISFGPSGRKINKIYHRESTSVNWFCPKIPIFSNSSKIKILSDSILSLIEMKNL